MYIDDQVLRGLDAECRYSFLVYEPLQTEVVLGRSCKAQEDVKVARCREDGIPILRRAGGGGTVVLCPGILVISVAGSTKVPFALREHMEAVNESIVSSLGDLGVYSLSMLGISDIAIENRKILGASLHRRKDIVLYQGSLLVRPEMQLFERYLTHPKKEPDYRKLRSHEDFMTSLFLEGYEIEISTLKKRVEAELRKGPPWASL